MPKLYRVILPVRDIETAVTFYSEILQISGERVSPGRHYFNLGGMILALYDPTTDGDELGSGWQHHENQYVYIGVENLEAVYDNVKTVGTGKILTDIEKMPWGERLFYVNDPSGNPVSFVDMATIFVGDG